MHLWYSAWQAEFAGTSMGALRDGKQVEYTLATRTMEHSSVNLTDLVYLGEGEYKSVGRIGRIGHSVNRS